MRFFQELRKARWAAVGMVGGALIGLYVADIARVIGVFGEMYLRLIQMCALPIVLTSLVSSFAKTLNAGGSKKLMQSVVMMFVFFLITASVIGLTLGTLTASLISRNPEDLSKLSGLFARIPSSTSDFHSSLVQLQNVFVPKNIFESLAQGHIVACIFFSILFGIALSKQHIIRRQALIDYVDTVNGTLFRMIEWFMAVLPIGLLCLFAKTFEGFGHDNLNYLMKIVGAVCVGWAALMVVLLGLVVLAKQRKAGATLKALMPPVMTALSTSSSLASLPQAMKTLVEKVQTSPGIVKLVMPLGIALCPFGSTFFDSFIISLVERIYHPEFSVVAYILIPVAAYLSAISSAGLPGVATSTIIAFILQPLGLPAEVVAVIFISIISFVDPLITLVNLFGHMTASIVLDRILVDHSGAEWKPANQFTSVETSAEKSNGI